MLSFPVSAGRTRFATTLSISKIVPHKIIVLHLNILVDVLYREHSSCFSLLVMPHCLL